MVIEAVEADDERREHDGSVVHTVDVAVDSERRRDAGDGAAEMAGRGRTSEKRASAGPENLDPPSSTAPLTLARPTDPRTGVLSSLPSTDPACTPNRSTPITRHPNDTSMASATLDGFS